MANGFCIKSCIKNGETFYNNQEAQSNGVEFPFPKLRNGFDSKEFIDDVKYYTITLNIRDELTNEAVLDEFFDKNVVFNLAYVDNNVDSMNYSNPSLKFLSRIGSFLSRASSSTNFMNFETFSILTNDNFIFNIDSKIDNYKFSFNDKFTDERTNQSLPLVETWIFLKNNRELYFRRYPKLQEVLASVGGFFNILYFSGSAINYYFNLFQIFINSSKNLIQNSFNYECLNESYSNLHLENENNKFSDKKLNFNSSNMKEMNSIYIKESNNDIVFNRNWINKDTEHIKFSNNTDSCIVKLRNYSIKEKQNFKKQETLQEFSKKNSTLSKKISFIFNKITFQKTFEDKVLKMRNNIINENNIFQNSFDILKIKMLLFNFIPIVESQIKKINILEFFKNELILNTDFDEYSLSSY